MSNRTDAAVQLAPHQTDITATEFFLANGRVPMLGQDEIKPWEYRGWMLIQVIEAYRYMPYRGLPDRYGYYLNVRDTGDIYGEPIPRLDFASAHSPERAEGLKMLRRAIDLAGESFMAWDAMRELIHWLGWALAVPKAERPRIDPAAQERLYRHFNFGPWLLAPSDYLGTMISEHKANGWNPTAFYPTPHEVCEMMVQMNMAGDAGDWKALVGAKVLDPALGTGRMLLHASNHSLRLHGMDIDPMVIEVSLINGALFAPWMTWPLPDAFFDTAPEAEPQRIIQFDQRGQGLLFESGSE